MPSKAVTALFERSDVIDELLERGGSEVVNVQDNEGKTALAYAVMADSKKIVEALLKKGADATLKDNQERNILHCAAESASEEVLEALFAALGDKTDDMMNAPDENGVTPKDIANSPEHSKRKKRKASDEIEDEFNHPPTKKPRRG